MISTTGKNRSRSSSCLVALCIVFLINFLASSEFWHLFLAMDDEAVTILGATRLLQGELPYRDWDTRHTPGSYFVSALFFAVTGTGEPWPRVLFSLISAGTAVGIQALSFRCLASSPRGLVYLPAFLFTTCGVNAFPILSYHWLGSFSVVWACWAVVCWQQQPRLRHACLVGAALAFSSWCLQSAGLMSILLTLTVAIRYRLPHVRALLLTMVGTSLILWMPLLPYPGPIWVASVVNIGRHLSFNYCSYSPRWMLEVLGAWPPFSAGTKFWHVLALRDEIVVSCFLYATIYLLAIAGILMAEFRRKAGNSVPGEEILPWALLLWLLVTHAQQTLIYISFLSPLWALVFAQGVARLPKAQWILGFLFAIESLGWGARWGLRRDAFIYSIDTRAGIYYSNSEVEAVKMHFLGKWMADLPPDTSLLAYPFLTSTYTLYHLKNPIREPVLQPFLYSEEAYQRCFRTLKEKQVPWLLIHSDEYSQDQSEFTLRNKPELERRIAQLTVEYEVAQSFYGLKLYRRKKSEQN